MTFFQKTIQFILSFTFFLLLTAENHVVVGQITSEQQEEINQYKLQIKDYKSKNQLKTAANYSNKCASIYLRAGNYQEAINSYLESVQINDQIGNDLDNKKIYNNIAMIYSEMGQLKNTLKYFEKSLLISRRYNNKKEIAVSLMDISTILSLNKEYDKAITYLEEALKLSQDINDLNNLRTCYNLMSQTYKAAGNTKKADEYYKYYLAYDKKIREGTEIPDYIKENFLKAESENLHALKTEKNIEEIPLNKSQKELKTSLDSLNFEIAASKAKAAELKVQVLKADNALNETKQQTNQKRNEENRVVIFSSILGIFILLLLVATGLYILQKKQKQIKNLEEKLAFYEKENKA